MLPKNNFKILRPIDTSILTLWLFIKLKQMILFVILFVLNIIFHVSDENYEVKKFEDLKEINLNVSITHKQHSDYKKASGRNMAQWVRDTLDAEIERLNQLEKGK